jgi:hypothetical protein
MRAITVDKKCCFATEAKRERQVQSTQDWAADHRRTRFPIPRAVKHHRDFGGPRVRKRAIARPPEATQTLSNPRRKPHPRYASRRLQKNTAGTVMILDGTLCFAARDFRLNRQTGRLDPPARLLIALKSITWKNNELRNDGPRNGQRAIELSRNPLFSLRFPPQSSRVSHAPHSHSIILSYGNASTQIILALAQTSYARSVRNLRS